MWFAIDMADGTENVWFYWPMLGTGIAVAVMAIVLFGIGGLFGFGWEQRQIERYLQQRGGAEVLGWNRCRAHDDRAGSECCRAPRATPEGLGSGPNAGDDLRGTSLKDANLLVPCHEVYAVDAHNGQAAGLPQVSYIAFVSQARNQATGVLAHVHWFTYTEEPGAVPGKYRDGKPAQITRSQTFAKVHRGETLVRETFSAVAEDGELRLSLAYEQGGLLFSLNADKPNLELYAAQDTATSTSSRS